MTCRKLLVCWQILVLMVATSTSAVQAAMIDTDQILALQQRQAQVERIGAVLAREEVGDQLMAFGLSRENALRRVAALSDQELQQLATQMDELPAGGNILALIGAVFVVLLILEVTGVINIFKGA